MKMSRKHKYSASQKISPKNEPHLIPLKFFQGEAGAEGAGRRRAWMKISIPEEVNDSAWDADFAEDDPKS